jgi:uncharacterized protein GlcG (DUF336 family)
MMFAAGCTFIISGPGIGWANTELPKEPDLPLTLAQKAAKAALVKCEEERWKVSVVVVDRGGNVKALLRGDRAGPHTQDSSARRTYTASSIRGSTQELAELNIKIPNFQTLGDMNERILILGGVVSVVLGSEIVGSYWGVESAWNSIK